MPRPKETCQFDSWESKSVHIISQSLKRNSFQPRSLQLCLFTGHRMPLFRKSRTQTNQINKLKSLNKTQNLKSNKSTNKSTSQNLQNLVGFFSAFGSRCLSLPGALGRRGWPSARRRPPRCCAAAGPGC